MKRFCVVCGSDRATPWTLLHGADTHVVTVCDEHTDPLRKLIELSEARPQSSDLPRVVRPKRAPLKPLDWTPPS